MGTYPMMHAGVMLARCGTYDWELMTEMWGFLTEEQKKKVVVMRMDILTQ